MRAVGPGSDSLRISRKPAWPSQAAYSGSLQLAPPGVPTSTLSEKSAARRGAALVGLEQEVLDDDAAVGGKGLVTALEQVEIFRGTEHVTDGGEEDEVVIRTERVFAQIAEDGGEVEDVGVKVGIRLGEGDGIGAGTGPTSRRQGTFWELTVRTTSGVRSAALRCMLAMKASVQSSARFSVCMPGRAVPEVSDAEEGGPRMETRAFRSMPVARGFV